MLVVLTVSAVTAVPRAEPGYGHHDHGYGHHGHGHGHHGYHHKVDHGHGYGHGGAKSFVQFKQYHKGGYH